MPGRTRIKGGSCEVDFKQQSGNHYSEDRSHDGEANYCELSKDGTIHYEGPLNKDEEWEMKWYEKKVS